MSVDYRLLTRFQASHDRHEAARRALPERWRSDPRAEVQHANELWVSAVARAREHQDRLAANSAPGPATWTKSGYVDRGRDGRRNRYSIRTDVSPGLPIQRDVDIGSLLDVLVAQDDAADK
jgi:hypothetical protein